ncbi:hemerythrin domain-containing protein [Aestuariimicrobium soli]|uniref:hemerythrin domain-containing protein n=1 Tax=Aestuariimicrobium soli TaxID=2035834 RepID=UPI003EB941CC
MTRRRSDRETTRLIAWSHELRRVHSRLREALRVTREAVHAGEAATSPARDLLLYCHGFCTALDAHHRGEDRSLFPAIEAAHPHLAPVLRSLERDHSMIDYLLNELAVAVDRAAPADELDRHLEGIGALMENHFRYEERQLLTVLETLELEAAVEKTLGPL